MTKRASTLVPMNSDKLRIKKDTPLQGEWMLTQKMIWNLQLVTPMATTVWLWYLQHAKRLQTRSQPKQKHQKGQKENETFPRRVQKDVKKIKKNINILKRKI